MKVCRVCRDKHYDCASWEECTAIAELRWPWMPQLVRAITCLLAASVFRIEAIDVHPDHPA